VIVGPKLIGKTTSLKQFLRKKQDEGFPILFLDSKNSNNSYQWFLDQKFINFIYRPAVKLNPLNGKNKKRDMIRNHFGDKPITIAIRIGDEMKEDN
jgi:predicted AAA+ superfamily ATPase